MNGTAHSTFILHLCVRYKKSYRKYNDEVICPSASETTKLISIKFGIWVHAKRGKDS